MKIKNIIFVLISASMLFGCSDESMFNKDSTDEVKAQLEHGAMSGKDLLLAAVSSNVAPSIIKKVVKTKEIPLTTDYDGRNLLYFAKSPDMIKFLAKEIPLNYIDDNEIPAIFTYSKPELAQTALDCLYEKFKANFASIKDKKEVQKKIIASFPQSMLDNAKNSEMIKFWLSFGINANISLKDSPLFVHRNNADILKTLLDKGANINAKNKRGKTLLQTTVENMEDWEKPATFLIENGADIYTKITVMGLLEDVDIPLIEYAIEKDKFDFAKLLIEKGYNVNHGNLLSTTIRNMCLKKSFDLNKIFAKLLLEKGADPNIKNDNGYAPLFFSIPSMGFGDTDCIALKFLLENGANPNTQNNEGDTLLHQGARCTNYEAIKILLEKGADPNIKNNKGMTPLRWAVDRVDWKAIEILVEKGADPNIKDNKGESPWTIAIRKQRNYANYDRVVEMLKAKGAR